LERHHSLFTLPCLDQAFDLVRDSKIVLDGVLQGWFVQNQFHDAAGEMGAPLGK
jgi:hypothetical protein